ncbi:MAG TPA: NADH:ubiquinone reductase (Na(+)-transporting) subunit C [Tenuifilaceae bacterium]|nr:NADH:ubiquinone reductase (Na(+)-transporting) subunit C [Tenuifilaceae bacterium]
MSILEKIRKVDKNSNAYIFAYASGMVIIVALLLAFAATALKPAQQRNVETEKRVDILKSIGEANGVDQAKDKYDFVAGLYSKYIVDQLVVNSLGDTIKGVNAFNIELHNELSKPIEQQNLPMFVAKLDNGSVKYIIPVRGKGLWGPIWGYIALNNDLSTIYGATFGHKGETPGLGAEIATPTFQKQFVGKTIYNEANQFTSIKVVKGGADRSDIHAVDAISGGTITSKGLEKMLYDCLSSYQAYFNKLKKLSNGQE